MSQRANRVSEEMKKELSDIIARKLKDPRIGFVTVTGVDVSGDLQLAKVFITVLGDEKNSDDTLAGLKKATGFIRSELGQRLKLRVTPEISFELDKAVEYGNHIENLLAKLKEE